MRTMIITAIAAIALVGPLAAQQPDFSGNWKLNLEKSDSMPAMGRMGNGNGSGPGGGGRGMMMPTELFINQMSSRMTVEQKSTERSRTMTFNLDGTESRNPGMMGNEFVTTSSWVGNTIVTKGKNTFKTPMGEATIETTEIRSLSDDGKTMTVEMTTVSPRGTMKRKLVYEKS